jgi:hypothetical protein
MAGRCCGTPGAGHERGLASRPRGARHVRPPASTLIDILPAILVFGLDPVRRRAADEHPDELVRSPALLDRRSPTHLGSHRPTGRRVHRITTVFYNQLGASVAGPDRPTRPSGRRSRR